MHELTVAKSIVEHARTIACEQGSRSINSITVRVGEKTHINPTQLSFCVETIATDDRLSEMDVIVETVPAKATCGCGWAGQPPSIDGTPDGMPSSHCPDCGNQLNFTQGEGCHLVALTPADNKPPKRSES